MDERRQEKSNMRGFGNGGPHGALMRGGEKARDFSGSLQKLTAFCKPYWPAMLIAALLAALSSILNIIGPGKLSVMTDLITSGMMTSIDLNAIVRTALILAVLYGLGFLFSLAQGIVMATVTQYVSKTLRTRIDCKINRLPLRYFDTTTTGDVLSRVTNDVDAIGQTLNQSLGTLVSSCATLAGALVMMLATNVTMTIAAVIASIIGFTLMAVIISHSQRYFAIQQNMLGRLNGHIEETYTGHIIVKAYNGGNEAKAAFRSMNEMLYTSAWKSQFMSGLMQPLMSFIGNFGYVVVCVVGAMLAVQGSISFGTIVAFILYVRLFTQPLTQLAQAATNLQSTAAASERVFAFLDEEEMADESDKTNCPVSTQGNVSFRHVCFGYDPAHPVITDFSAEVTAGQKIAIVGPTGAGKTTLINLLMRFYEVQRGEILIDGVPISQMKREDVHGLFGMVLQDTWLFDGTVRENIAYAKEGVTAEQVASACKAVGLHHFIMTLPDGYDTVLSDHANLSTGQRQLITIARAMVENAPMLILDEATSSVDTRTELIIQRAMAHLMEGRTSFVIAHRLSTIRNADLILVLKGGDIIESGTHEELMTLGGFYQALYNSQFEAA